MGQNGVSNGVKAGKAMRTDSVRFPIVLMICAGFVCGFVLAAGYLSVFVPERLPAPDVTISPFHSNRVEDRKSEPITVIVEDAQPKSTVGPQQEVLRFKGEYAFAKACLQIQQGLAMYELHKFRVVEMMRASQKHRDRFQKPDIWIIGIGRPRGLDSVHPVVGRIYEVRVAPSEETWRRIDQGSGSISVPGDELEVVPNDN